MINKLTVKNKIVILVAILGVVLAGLTAITPAEQGLSKIIFYVG